MNSTRSVAARAVVGMENQDPDKPNSGGEFTRLFRGVEPAGKPPSPEPPKPADPAAIPSTRPLTKMFTAKAQPQRPEHAPAPPAYETKIGPGEFTRIFGPPPPVTPPAPAQPPTPLPVKEPSFTEVFNAPHFSAPAEKPADWKEAENRAPQPPSRKEAGDFTQMFGQKPAAARPLASTTEHASAWSPTSFDPPITADEFSKVVAASRPKAAPAAVASQSGPTSEIPAKKLPALWIPLVLICAVLIASAFALYWFVVRP